jgi:hypothetical protein
MLPGRCMSLVRLASRNREVLDFGKRFVPLSYHTDPELARKSIYGGLIASGWHTAALMMRLYTDHYLSKIANLGSPGADELKWDRPVFPGDDLSIRVTVLETRRSESKADRGIIRSFVEVAEPKPPGRDERKNGELCAEPREYGGVIPETAGTKFYASSASS